MYKRCLNIPKMITLQGICTWTTEALSFICCDCAHGAISLSRLHSLLSQPGPLIIWATVRGRLGQGWQSAGWCWIRRKFTWCQHTSRQKSAPAVKRISPLSVQPVLPPLSDPSLTQELSWDQQLSPESFLQGQLARELQPFVSDVTLPTHTHFLKIRLWQHMPHSKVPWLSSTGQYRTSFLH